MASPKFWDISIIFGDFSMLSKLKFVSDYKPKWFARKILESFINRVKKYHGLKVNDFFLQQKTRKMKISWKYTFFVLAICISRSNFAQIQLSCTFFIIVVPFRLCQLTACNTYACTNYRLLSLSENLLFNWTFA